MVTFLRILFRNGQLLFHVKPRQVVVHHHNGVDVIRLSLKGSQKFPGKLRPSSMPLPVSQDQVKIRFLTKYNARGEYKHKFYLYQKDLILIELYELRQFLAFANAGPLSEASETLHLSQPALSRNMKKLEEDWGISLFLHQKNKLELNENGMYVLELTKKLLEDANLLAAKARDYDRRNRTITLGLCAPAPAWLLTPLLSNLYPHMTLQT